MGYVGYIEPLFNVDEKRMVLEKAKGLAGVVGSEMAPPFDLNPCAIYGQEGST